MLHVVNDRGEPCPDWVVGEIEATLATHPEVARAVAVTATEGGRARSLHAFVATLIRTEGGFPPEFLDHEPTDSLPDPGLGWTDLVQGRLEVRTMPGDHLSILDGDGLPVMARPVGQIVGAATRH